MPIPRGIGEWQFPIPWVSGKLKAIPWVLGEFWGIVFPLNEKSLVHNQHYTLNSFMFYKQHMIEKTTKGQTISKANYGFLNSPQKKKETNFPK